MFDYLKTIIILLGLFMKITLYNILIYAKKISKCNKVCRKELTSSFLQLSMKVPKCLPSFSERNTNKKNENKYEL